MIVINFRSRYHPFRLRQQTTMYIPYDFLRFFTFMFYLYEFHRYFNIKTGDFFYIILHAILIVPTFRGQDYMQTLMHNSTHRSIHINIFGTR